MKPRKICENGYMKFFGHFQGIMKPKTDMENVKQISNRSQNKSYDLHIIVSFEAFSIIVYNWYVEEQWIN
uniref:Uncharacterized protein n=1 Tax=Cannabis sativa TaxID=3483 RepID=A0A803R1M6_CANSA